ncbi:MAG: cob(I)yrinic acid a,c-diamide adenosyltransferase [Chloroflexi bacterium]|nr:cob(I)yrinic acid a,c-diamide adenosyltransferase [Chloroflexota bacterium]
MVKLYTKTGDKGETGLLYGGRVSKTDPRVEAYGTVDEANSAMGLARALSKDSQVKEWLVQLQRELFTVGAELATDAKTRDTFLQHFPPVAAEMTARLEGLLDKLEEEVPLPRSFIIPGATPASAALDLARSVLRRAERRAVGLKNQGLLGNEEILRYLNRLNDLLFMLARYEDRHLPMELLTAGRSRPRPKAGV